MSDGRVADLVGSASVGEVAWLDDDGLPRAAGVLPLVLDGRVVLALTLDQSRLASDLAGAEVVDLVVREPRNVSAGWRPGAWRCHSRLVEDLAGETWLDHLRVQELRRYPPARRYADSPLLCREHWWYLPRLLVDLSPGEVLEAPPARNGPEDLTLVTVRDRRPVVSGVSSVDGTLAPTWGPGPAAGAGVVLGQDATFPDLEVWTRWTRAARVTGDRVSTEGELPRPVAPRIPGLLARWRRERELARACRRGIEAWSG